LQKDVVGDPEDSVERPVNVSLMGHHVGHVIRSPIDRRGDNGQHERHHRQTERQPGPDGFETGKPESHARLLFVKMGLRVVVQPDQFLFQRSQMVDVAIRLEGPELDRNRRRAFKPSMMASEIRFSASRRRLVGGAGFQSSRTTGARRRTGAMSGFQSLKA